MYFKRLKNNYQGEIKCDAHLKELKEKDKM